MTRPATSFCYLLILAIAPTLALAAPKAIQRRAYVRKGPGPYYDLVLKLSAGDVVTKAASNKQWVRITAKQGSGWVVDKAFVKPKARVDYSGMLADPGMKKAYSVDIAAATKGAFLTTYSNKKDMNVDVAIMVDKSRINVQLVANLQSGLTGVNSIPLLSRMPRKPFRNTVVLDFDAESAFGQTLLARVITSGVVTRKQITDYVNAVAQVVAAKSERYDVPFKVAILEDETINGFGLPGGYILISMGLLKTMNDESELACLLGHEIAHISLYHGLRELDARSLHRRADSAFDELDSELGESPSDAEQDLRTIADEAYLKIIGRRAREDEVTADAHGAVYAAAAGYNPEAMIRVLKRIEKMSKQRDSFRHHPPIAERIAALKKMVSKHRLERDAQQDMAERFEKYIR